MKVIGLVGHTGAGKHEVVDYLRDRYGVEALSAADVIRRLAAEEGLSGQRDDLDAIAEQYRRTEGSDFVMRRIIEAIEQPPAWDVVAVTSIRTPTDVQVLRQHFGDDFLLAHVCVSDAHARFERLQARGRPRDPDSFEALERRDERDDARFRLSETIQLADVTLENDGSKEELHRKIERMIVKRELRAHVPRPSPDDS